jgi:apolipoprotein N-acyltransferase
MISPKALIVSICFSFFIYLEYFGISVKVINTIFALSSFILLLQLTKKELFQSGFFIGVLWFWWIALSFTYYDLSYLIPIVIIFLGFAYGMLFYTIGVTTNIFIKIGIVFLLSFIEPFGFNWLKPELLFINSYLGTSKIEFFIILFLSALLVHYKKNIQSISIYFTGILFLYFFNIFSYSQITASDLKIYQFNTKIDQEKRWDKKYKPTIIGTNFNVIEDAIKNNYDLIIFPETAFPLILNHQKELLKKLDEYSQKITILTGALYEKENKLYNSSYLFNKKQVVVANKVVLVPFGEAVPFPEKIRNLINDIFYGGAKDYQVAVQPTTFDIKGYKFRNAICYEATTDAIFQNLDAKYMIAISNNAWFTPSIEPALQKLLLQYYAKKYNIYIYSVSNS